MITIFSSQENGKILDLIGSTKLEVLRIERFSSGDIGAVDYGVKKKHEAGFERCWRLSEFHHLLVQLNLNAGRIPKPDPAVNTVLADQSTICLLYTSRCV